MTNNGHPEGALLFILFATGSSEKLGSPPERTGYEVMMLGQESRALILILLPAPSARTPQGAQFLEGHLFHRFPQGSQSPYRALFQALTTPGAAG